MYERSKVDTPALLNVCTSCEGIDCCERVSYVQIVPTNAQVRVCLNMCDVWVRCVQYYEPMPRYCTEVLQLLHPSIKQNCPGAIEQKHEWMPRYLCECHWMLRCLLWTENEHTRRFWMSIVTHEKIRGESFLAREGLSSFKNSSTYHTPCYSSWTYDWHTSSTMIVQISCTSEWYTSSLKPSSSHQMLYRQAKEDSGRIFSSKRGM